MSDQLKGSGPVCGVRATLSDEANLIGPIDICTTERAKESRQTAGGHGEVLGHEHLIGLKYYTGMPAAPQMT